jgi:hypothetical protein
MSYTSPEQLLQQSIQGIRSLEPAKRDQALRLVAHFAEYIRMQASGAGPTTIPVSGAGTSSGLPGSCPICGASIKVVLSP